MSLGDHGVAHSVARCTSHLSASEIMRHELAVNLYLFVLAPDVVTGSVLSALGVVGEVLNVLVRLIETNRLHSGVILAVPGCVRSSER